MIFSQVNYLVKLAKSRTIEATDFPQLSSDVNPSNNKNGPAFPLARSTFKQIVFVMGVFRRRVLKGWSFYLVFISANLLSPNLINWFIRNIEAGLFGWQTFLLGAALAANGVIAGVSLQHYFFHCLRAYQGITNYLNEKIFEKSLGLSLEAKAKSQIGDLVNHMSTDTDCISDLPLVLGDLIWCLSLILGVAALLFYYIGASAVLPLILLAGLIPLTSFAARHFVKYDEKMMDYRDRRISLMGQILNAIRVVKYFVWEKGVDEEVGKLRAQELEARRKLAWAEMISGLCYLAVGTVVLFVALAVHVWRGQELSAALIFTCISLFALLEEPFGHLSHLFSRLTQAVVSMRRINRFLSLPSKPMISMSVLSARPQAMEMKGVSVGYATMAKPLIADLHLSLAKGEALAVVGPVGAGKTSLLLSLLGEIDLQGRFRLPAEVGRPAYVSQEAFILNGSLEDNILFGQENVSSEEMKKALYLSCLEKDLQAFASGLNTEIGERGVNLSGGQKQRVSLARAVLAKADLILLDDPLSAVDENTEEELCRRLLFGHWNDKTRIVATHRLKILERFSKVLFLHGDGSYSLGSYQELYAREPRFREFLVSEMKTDTDTGQKLTRQKELELKAEESSSRLTEDEDREVGAVKKRIYTDYFSALAGQGKYQWVVIAGLLGGALLACSLPLAQRTWMSDFAKHSQSLGSLWAVAIYGLLGLGVLLFSLLNQVLWLERGLIAGKNLHQTMLTRVLGTHIRFFDATPIGRILQRFSRDVESVDIHLQRSFESLVHCTLNVVVSIVVIIALLPAVALVIVPVLWIYFRLQGEYRVPAREAKRLDSIARSPRYAHFKETLQGLSVLRAFQKEDWFRRHFFAKLEYSQRMFFGHYLLNRWFSSRIPLVGGVISLASLMGMLWFAKSGWLESGICGLITLYSLSFWSQLNWGVRIFADIESRMTSVERLKFYAELPSENQTLIPTEPVPQWPAQGKIEAVGLKAKYASHLPEVLKGISFCFEGGQKIGIIGRTGSGKSTLFQLLYRFLNPSEGEIKIDGVNIAQIPLAQLRSSLAIVPQDPLLFMGPLRANLDRYNQYSDQEVWHSLDQVGLRDFFENSREGLSFNLLEGGGNLSQGQRQLVCFARALLMNSKIILLDEATASVDQQTDAKIQNILRQKFVGKTILIIAHRLLTIADCDQILQLEDGLIIRTEKTEKREFAPQV